MTPTAFRAWRNRMGLSLTGAGLALGISRRMVAAYQSGEYPVPEKIARLCVYMLADKERNNG